MTEKEWTAQVWILLRHPHKCQVLTLQTETGPGLPRLSFPERVWFSDVADICQNTTERIGIPVWALRQCHFSQDDERALQYSCFELEIPQDARASALANVESSAEQSWLPIGDVPDLTGPPEAVLAALRAYADGTATGRIPKQRAAWAKPDWCQSVWAWSEKELAARALKLHDIEQVKQWGISSILRLKTDGPDVYFKATGASELFINEGQVSNRLHRFFPDRIPKPLAYSAPDNWMLLADFGKNQSMDLDLLGRLEIIDVHVDIQLCSIDQAEVLIAAGCLDRRIPTMKAQIDPLFHDPEAIEGLTDEQRQRLLDLRPILIELLDELDARGIPPALVHGDLEPHNTARLDGHLVIFDWTDASISHPFFDYMMTFGMKDETMRAAMKARYLQAWQAHTSPENMTAAWDLAKVLFRLYLAVSHQYIVACLEPDAKIELNLGWFITVKKSVDTFCKLTKKQVAFQAAPGSASKLSKTLASSGTSSIPANCKGLCPARLPLEKTWWFQKSCRSGRSQSGIPR